MKIKFRTQLFLFFSILLVFQLSLVPTITAENKDVDMDVWLEETLNPAVIDIITEFNNTTRDNWYINLSNYLINGDKDDAVEKLKSLNKDIDSIKKEIKAIEYPESANRKEKKQVKKITKELTKTLDKTSKRANKLIKKLDKNKEIKSIPARKYESKRVDKANKAYISINKLNEISVKEIPTYKHTKINKKTANEILNDPNSYFNLNNDGNDKSTDQKNNKTQKETKAVDNRTLVEKIQEDDKNVDLATYKDGTLTLETEAKSLWSENSLFYNVYDLFESTYVAFKDKSVDEVKIVITTSMTDTKGNESIEPVIEYGFSREMIEELNYDNFSFMAYGEPWRVLNESSYYWIHPGIYKNLKSEYIKNLNHGFSKQ